MLTKNTRKKFKENIINYISPHYKYEKITPGNTVTLYDHPYFLTTYKHLKLSLDFS